MSVLSVAQAMLGFISGARRRSSAKRQRLGSIIFACTSRPEFTECSRQRTTMAIWHQPELLQEPFGLLQRAMPSSSVITLVRGDIRRISADWSRGHEDGWTDEWMVGWDVHGSGAIPPAFAAPPSELHLEFSLPAPRQRHPAKPFKHAYPRHDPRPLSHEFLSAPGRGMLSETVVVPCGVHSPSHTPEHPDLPDGIPRLSHAILYMHPQSCASQHPYK